MIEKILAVLREKAYTKQPSVNDLKVIEGLNKITAAERDEAWTLYQAEQEAEKKAETDADVIANEVTQSQEATTPTTSTTPETETDTNTDVIASAAKQSNEAETVEQDTVSTETVEGPTHRVVVKREGFRRLGRAWTQPEEVCLSDEEFEILNADPMFVVTEL
jgi:ketosteroid isomerase-like protein